MVTPTWSTTRIPNKEVLALYTEWKAGTPIRTLASRKGTTKESIYALFKSRNLSLALTKTCELPECEVVFVTKSPRQRACCKRHVKLLGSREERGATTLLLPCALPECTELVWMTHKAGQKPDFGGRGGSGKRYCCKEHGEVMYRRRHSGSYARLLLQDAQCAAPGCKETLILDQHHEDFAGARSDKDSKTHWLCPTHHMQIHRGFADIVAGKFVSLVPKIKAGIKAKTKVFERYVETITDHGYSWAQAK